MDKAVKVVVEELEKQAVVVGSNKEKIKQVATISANNDSTIGDLIADAFEKVGTDGVITVEESKGLETSMELVEGMQFDKGYMSSHFVTNQDKMTAVLENPYILTYDGRVSNMNDILPLLEGISQQSRSLLIIADDVDAEILGTLVVNKLRGLLSTVCVKAPAFGDRKKAMLEDIAILTGGTFITPETGYKLSEVTLDNLGTAEKVTVGKDSTTIVNGSGSTENISQRIQQIKNEIENTTSDYDREKLQERLAKLSGGVAVLYIGAGSEVELKEKKDRVDDALQATRAAIAEGIVVGGGVALLKCSDKIQNLMDTETLGSAELNGVKVIQFALQAPITQILENAGLESEEIIQSLFTHFDVDGGENMGFDAKTQEFVDMFQSGIIDPKKVTREAIQNATSVVGMILTTECMVVDKPEEKPKFPMMSQMM
jgi:chaperonin GroEL